MERKWGVPPIEHAVILFHIQTHLVDKQLFIFVCLFFTPIPLKISAKLKKKKNGRRKRKKKGCDAATRQDKHNSKAQSDEVVH